MQYGIDMTIRHILEDEETAALFAKCLPGVDRLLGTNAEAKNMTVRQLAGYAGGRLPKQALDALDAGLKAIGEKNGGISPAERKRMERYQAIAAADAARKKGAVIHHQDAVYPGKPWLDVTGNRIQAHAGGFLYEDGTYYWYGENKEHTDGVSEIWTWGIRLYSSQDFCNWEDRGLIIPPVLDDPNSELYPEKHIDRPHIVKNPNTGKYVCWYKNSGSEACFNVLTAGSLFGPWKFAATHLNPFGLRIGDFDLAVDGQSGLAYLYCEVEHKQCVGFRLNRNYTDVLEIISHQYDRLDPPFTREGQSICLRNGKLWMLTSGMTGYVPNQSDSAVSAGFRLPFVPMGDPHVGDDTLSSFNSQIGQIFKVPGKRDMYLAVADRWVPGYPVDRERALALRRATAERYDSACEASAEDRALLAASPMLGTANTSVADYVILPIVWVDDRLTIPWKDEWRLEDYQ